MAKTKRVQKLIVEWSQYPFPEGVYDVQTRREEPEPYELEWSKYKFFRPGADPRFDGYDRDDVHSLFYKAAIDQCTLCWHELCAIEDALEGASVSKVPDWIIPHELFLGGHTPYLLGFGHVCRWESNQSRQFARLSVTSRTLEGGKTRAEACVRWARLVTEFHRDDVIPLTTEGWNILQNTKVPKKRIPGVTALSD